MVTEPTRLRDSAGREDIPKLWSEDLLATRQELELARGELEALLGINQAVSKHLHLSELFDALASCLKGLLPSDRFGVELPAGGDYLETHILSPLAATRPTRVEQLPSAGTACRWVQENRRWIVSGSRQELAERFPVTFEVMRREGMESLCALPLVSEERSIGVLFFMAASKGAYDNPSRSLLAQVAGAVAVALDNCLAHEEVRRLRDRLAAENVYLQEEIRQQQGFHEIVGRCPALLAVLDRVEVVAGSDTTVLVLGETGTGKELIARAIHDRSARRDRPLVKVNCSAISAGLVESELFGHVKGAFTGAVASRTGRFELADGGTIFLDEIGELSPETQVKLLRVLQEREFERVGSSETRKVDVRVIAATNRDLKRLMQEGKFRADLFYRLHVMPIEVPPLRRRREDIPLLFHYFQERFSRELGKPVEDLPEGLMDQLSSYDWPGNVRELQNAVERFVVLSGSGLSRLDAGLLPGAPPSAEDPPHPAEADRGPRLESLEEVERAHVLAVLEEADWVIEGPDGAARLLGLRPSTLRSRMKKLGLERPPVGV